MSASRILSALVMGLAVMLGAVNGPCPCLGAEPGRADEMSMLNGKVTDVDGRAVEGAMVFLYSGQDVRRTADFISAPTDGEGRYRIVLPEGRYWGVARLKMEEGFGPLMPGDKHSGEPREIELAAGGKSDVTFVVADLREAMAARSKGREGPVRISGRIINGNGDPARHTYAIANRQQKVSGVPDYLSAWVDENGRYVLVVPRGRYHVGSATVFPPGDDYQLDREVSAEGDIEDFDLIRDASPGR